MTDWSGGPLSASQAAPAGYGPDPREPEAWRIMLLREAIATAVWSRRVGDERFEAQGNRMLAEALERFR